MHLKPMKFDRQAAEADPLIAIAGGGGGVNLFNSQGNATPGPPITWRLPASSTLTCAAISQRRRGPRSSMSG
jgi:hypothetical protein